MLTGLVLTGARAGAVRVGRRAQQRGGRTGRTPDVGNQREKLKGKPSKFTKPNLDGKPKESKPRPQPPPLPEVPDRAWQEGDPVTVLVKDVSWTPAVANAGENGRCAIKQVLESVTWGIQGTERVGLIGPNGCGKSTQLLMIQGLIEPTEGEITLHPPNMKIAYMQQEADLDTERTVFEELHFTFNDRSLDEIDQDLEKCSTEEELLDKMGDLLDERAVAEQHLEEVEALVEQLGVQEYRNTRVTELSGGYQMRVALGKIILERPHLILLDEPTNHVDLETVEFMEKLLASQSVAMVIVSHDRYFLNKVCTRIVEITDGQAKSYQGNYVQYLKRKDANLAKAWVRYNKWFDEKNMLEKQLRKLEERMITEKAAQKREELALLLMDPAPKPQFTSIANFRFPCSLPPRAKPDRAPAPVSEAPKPKEEDVIEAEIAEEEAEVLRQVEGEESPKKLDPYLVIDVELDQILEEAEQPTQSSKPALFRPRAPSARADVVVDGEPPLLTIEDLHVSYGDQAVLKGLSMSLRRGERVALVGRNGCGKSTLVKAIMKDLGANGKVQGYIDFTSGGLAYFPQRLAEAMNNERRSVKDALYLSCGVNDIEQAGGMDAVLKRLRLDGVTQEQPISNLSGGEKGRVAFAKFLLAPCAVLLLDEPTNHLDIPTRELLEDALKEFDGAAIVVSHDRFFLREFATRVVEVRDGRAVNYDGWEEYSNAAPVAWQAAQEGEVEFIKQDGVVSYIWSKKKMARLRRREGNVGLRRLSKRANEFIPDETEDQRVSRERKILERIIAKGVDPTLLGPELASVLGN